MLDEFGTPIDATEFVQRSKANIQSAPSGNYGSIQKSIISQVQTPKKRDLTYDDILASMNLKVNNGQLQYIQPQTSIQNVPKITPRVKPVQVVTIPQVAPIQQVKRVQIHKPESFSQPSRTKLPYLNILPRSREEHAKMLGARHQEAIRKVKPVPKPTQLLFTNNNNMYDFYAPSIRSTDHFLKFVKNK
jgi:hypothetical protein